MGYSAVAQYCEIQNKAGAFTYWNDSVLSSHLLEISRALLKLDDPIDRIVGYPDNLKVRSCLTLFWRVTEEQLFKVELKTVDTTW